MAEAIVIITSNKFKKDVQVELLKGDCIIHMLFFTAQIKYTVSRDSSIFSTDKLLPNRTKTLPLQLLDAQYLEIMRKELCGVHSMHNVGIVSQTTLKRCSRVWGTALAHGKCEFKLPLCCKTPAGPSVNVSPPLGSAHGTACMGWRYHAWKLIRFSCVVVPRAVQQNPSVLNVTCTEVAKLGVFGTGA